jgi:hypothetical protein
VEGLADTVDVWQVFGFEFSVNDLVGIAYLGFGIEPTVFSRARTLLRVKASARMASAETTSQDSSSSQRSRMSGLGATSRGSSQSTRLRMLGTTRQSWIFVTTSPVDWTV